MAIIAKRRLVKYQPAFAVITTRGSFILPQHGKNDIRPARRRRSPSGRDPAKRSRPEREETPRPAQFSA